MKYLLNSDYSLEDGLFRRSLRRYMAWAGLLLLGSTSTLAAEDALPSAPAAFSGGDISFAALNTGEINGQDSWLYTAGTGTPSAGVAVAEGGLSWTAADGGQLLPGAKHLYTQAGLDGNPKMNNWLAYTPVSIAGPAYVRFVTQFETRAEGVFGTDPYELFIGLTNNAAANGAPWNAYAALKHPVVAGNTVGVETTNSGGVQANAKVVLDAPMLVVVKYEVDGDGRLTGMKVWVNPNEADEANPDHTVTFSVPGVVLADQTHLKLRAQNMPTRIDHLRVSTSWADVVPEGTNVPPPPVPPEITIDVANIEAEVGQSAVLSVAVTGTTPFTFVWTKDGEVIPGVVGPTLTLNPLTLADAGVYRVLVSNAATVDPVESGPITVVVTEPVPPAPIETFLLETFDAVAEGEGFVAVDVTTLGWNVHHSFAGVYLPGLPTGNDEPKEVFRLMTSSQIGDSEFGTPNGYMEFFVNNAPLYGMGEEGNRPALPGPHPVTGQYYSNRTLATFLWKEVAIDEDGRSRIREFNFVQGNRDAIYHQFFPAVRIGDQWFVYIVSNEVLRDQVRILGRPSANGAFGEEGVFKGNQFYEDYANHYNAQPYHFTWSETGWTELIFNGGPGQNSTVGMVLGSPLAGELPAGAITALGVFSPENIDPNAPSAPGYNFNGLRIDSIHVFGEPSGILSTFSFTFNNEGNVEGIDRPIQAANWDGVYSAAALPLVTSESVIADLSEGVTSEETPGAYKAGFLFVSGRNDQPAPGAFLVGTNHLNVVNSPQLPQGGAIEVNPQTDWYAAPGAFTNDLGTLRFSQIRELTIRTRPRNIDTVTYHFALQLDGQWYVSATGFQNPVNDWALHTLDATSSNWYTGVVANGSLNIDFAANPPTLLTPAQMPASALLTGIGFYIHTGEAVGQTDSWARVDSVTLTANSSTGIRPPVIVQGPDTQTVIATAFLTLSVRLLDPTGEETFQWLKDGEPIEGATAAYYLIQNAKVEDSGVYSVAVTNAGGTSIGGPAQVTVVPLPVVTPTLLEVPFGGGVFTATVTADAFIQWFSGPNVPWISVSAGVSGFGNGQVTFSVAPNNNVAPRSGLLEVAFATIAIQQAGMPAFYDIFPDSASLPVAGGSEIIEVEATPGAAWTAVSNAPWIVVTAGASGSGPGEVAFSVMPHTGTSPRTGTLEVAGLVVTVTQAATAPATVIPGAVGTGVENVYSFAGAWLGSGYLVSSEEAAYVFTDVNGWWAMLVLAEGFWAWDYFLKAWLFTDDTLYPWVYSPDYPGWLYVDPTASPRLFWEWTAEGWVSIPEAELLGTPDV